MTDDRYVSTKDIRAAVAGRETDILDGLGILWRKGNLHLRCPYPTHAGEDDWRWDPKRLRAHCTCNDPGRADTVFHVVEKTEGLDFEAAKLRMAELLGREDLVRTKKGGGQRQDAASLLNPPADNAYPDLPRLYLAHRLKVEPVDVLMPITAVAGFRMLGFFDAPEKAGGKFAHVGDFPCAVFAQAGADGRTHAHRIYTAPAGAGKADVGLRASGRPRDPKKSAKVSDGDNTAGRSVIWGNPRKAERIITTEGIETGAAVAHAFRVEIEAGAVAVAATISASGVQAFMPYETTKRVTVAADRDEKIIPSKPMPSRAGEKAARAFGMAQHERLTVDIALPGAAGTKTDWLDVLLADGVEAVRAGIDGAVRFVPTKQEIEDRDQRLNRDEEVQRVAAEYPLPAMYGMQLQYRHTGREVMVHKIMLTGKGEDQREILVPVCTPFGVPARLRFADGAKNYGLRLVVKDMAGQPQIIDVERADFAKVGAADARSMLFNAGLRVVDDGEKIAVDCLKEAAPAREIVVVRKPGWHDTDGTETPIFACPDGRMLGLPEGIDIELSAGSQLSPASARGGTLQGWKDAVKVAVGVAGCPHWALGAVAAFAGPLIDLAGLDSCGINFSGLTSSGKTTAQRLAASAWSKPTTKGDTLFQTAKATVNSLEQMAARSNGTVLVLDELAHVTGKEVGKIVYTLAGGTGKKRMGADASVRATYSWSTFAVLSAETSLEEKIRKDDGEWTGGQAVRMADIDVTGIDRKVASDVLGRIDGIRANFGHAGPAFVEGVIAAGLHRDPEQIRKGIITLAERIAAVGAGKDKQDAAVERSALLFGVLTMAGGLAQQFGLLPEALDINRVVRWAWGQFRGSSDAAALDPEQQAIGNIRAWVAERWGVSLHDLNADARPNREAVGWFDEDAIYLTDRRLIEAAGGTLKETEIAKSLKGAGCILRTKGERHYYVDYVPKVGKIKAYVLSRDHFGRGSERAPFKVFNGGRP